MKNATKVKKTLVIAIMSLILVLSVGGTVAMVDSNVEKSNDFMPTTWSQFFATSSPTVKPMVFYLHNDTHSHLIFDYSTTYIFDTTLRNRVQSVGDIQRVRLNFYLFPQLAGNLHVQGNITVGVYINTTGVSANANLYAALYDVKSKSGSTTNETLVGDGGPVSYTVTSTIDYYEVTISNINYTFNKSDSMRLYIEVQGGASSYFTVWYGSSTYDSRVKIDCTNYMNIDSVKTVDYTGNYTVFFDPDANNKTLTVETNISDPFGGYDIYWVNVTIKNPKGKLVVNNQSMILTSGTPKSYISTYGFKWNYSSYPKGQYDVYIWAVDNNGHYYYWHFEQYNYGVYDETAYTYFEIGYKYRVDVMVYDTAGTPVPNAEVMLIDPYGSVVSSNVTNTNGYTTFLAYNGTYSIDVLWHGNSVVWAGTHIIVNGNNYTGTTVFVHGHTSIRLYADLGHLYLYITDSHNMPLESALTFVAFPNGTHKEAGYADAAGEISMGYSPGGVYHLSIYWKDVLVYNGNIIVHFKNGTAMKAISISTEVYYLTLTVLNNNNTGMPYLQVVVYGAHTQLVEEVGITNATGTVTIRLPVGEKNIKIYLQDHIVYAVNNYSLSKDTALVVHAWVYSVSFRVYDSQNKPVSNAKVLIYREGKLISDVETNGEGICSASLIKGNYSVSVFWQGVKVNSTYINISDNSTFNISTSIYYLKINLVGSDGNPVAGTILITKNGKTIYSGYGSNVEVRLPEGVYTVNATISKEMYLNGVREKVYKAANISGDLEISLHFKKYPIGLIGSNLFYVVLGYLVMIAAIIGLLFLMRESKPNNKENKVQENKMEGKNDLEKTENKEINLEENIDEIDEL